MLASDLSSLGVSPVCEMLVITMTNSHCRYEIRQGDLDRFWSTGK